MRLIHSNNDGMQFRGHGETAVWVKVLPNQPGRFPQGEHWQWIRLDTITAVIPKITIQVGDDPAEWIHHLIVEAGGRLFHPSALEFEGASINAPVERLLALISALHAGDGERSSGA